MAWALCVLEETEGREGSVCDVLNEFISSAIADRSDEMDGTGVFMMSTPDGGIIRRRMEFASEETLLAFLAFWRTTDQKQQCLTYLETSKNGVAREFASVF